MTTALEDDHSHDDVSAPSSPLRENDMSRDALGEARADGEWRRPWVVARLPATRYAGRRLAHLIIGGILFAPLGCASIGFYGQAISGQIHLLSNRQAVDEIIARSPDATLREDLFTINGILDFAASDLALPVGGRYRSYVEVEGRYIVWNVVAADEFETRALARCYPLVGCAVYRGYFKETNARREASRLARRGYDVFVGGAAAYSTLGWFDDPLMSTFVGWGDLRVAELLFHELAHSVVFIKGDSAFNEAFASFVGERGAVAWLMGQGRDASEYVATKRAERRLFDYLDRWRSRLGDIYALSIPVEEKRERKAAALARMTACYAAHREQLGNGRYDRFMNEPFNNARLATISTYHVWTAAFEALFVRSGQSWDEFYDAVEALGAQPEADRVAKLRELRDEQVTEGRDDGNADQIEC